MRTRYVITHVKNGLRVLTNANQGRYHFDTREAAQAWLDLFKGDQGLPRVLTPEQVASLRVTETECYDHGDAVRSIFGEE
jgi:hypothetical protein